ncbi:MAG TPA: adenylate/guanylate cyclase domain-containing protein [Mycobacteriales bacterium]|nr:adenylate/guanylate cyclase domain-containing protein [Mycobacteriales bacterium]
MSPRGWLAGLTDRQRLAKTFIRRMSVAMIGSNVLGGTVVFVYLVWLVPDRPGETDTTTLVNSIAGLAYMGAALVAGTVGSVVLQRRLLRWLRPGHVIDEQDRRTTLRLPARLVRLYGALWLVAAVVFAAINIPISLAGGLDTAGTIALGGATTCALCYLLAERIVRPLVAEAMGAGDDAPPVVLGVRRRVLLSWGLGTGIPLLGIGLAMVPDGREEPVGAPAVLFLCGVGLAVGLLAMDVAARSVSEPVADMTAALRRVGQGRLDIRVPVDDVSELGQLQSGFNAMVGGLREREQLRDLFGRQVGTAAARLSLEQGVQLGGERRDVAVLFVDVVGSTSLAVEAEPEEVVRRLNEFFAVVVDVVTAHHGWVNKFEGDAALCVFGAPERRTDAAACALACARVMAGRLSPLPLDAAIGVSAGPVVAGHIGTEERFEYTVIGDPVNAAARLTDLAKKEPRRVLADAAVVAAAGPESAEWEECGQAVLRGRARPTGLSRPRAGR